MKRNWYFTIAFAISTITGFATHQPLTFEERVRAQEAIERVYYSHRIWPKENHRPKPSFEQMVPRWVIEAKVADGLKKCNALNNIYHRPIEPRQLQAEMDRIASLSKDPATLRELFAALGNDPCLIAECLVRPLFAEKQLIDLYEKERRDTLATDTVESRDQGGSDMRLVLSPTMSLYSLNYNRSESTLRQSEKHGCTIPGFSEWFEEISEGVILDTQTEGGHGVFYSYRLPVVSESVCTMGEWTPINEIPDGRNVHTAVWTGIEMIIWGGGSSVMGFNSGGRYNPSTDSWLPTSTSASVPTPRFCHSAIWTGTEMVVWGGRVDVYSELKDGGRYNPITDEWRPTSKASAPTARYQHTVIWTGSEMIVWGGYGHNSPDQYKNSGGRYNPETDSWLPTSTVTGVPKGRLGHSAVWTGSEMIIWGGKGESFLNTGGRYNPATDTWLATALTPSARAYHTAVWTGSEMIIWGGKNLNTNIRDGAKYNPSSDSWATTSAGENCPSARDGHTAVWTGDEMIIWGGLSPGDTGGIYHPNSNSWRPISDGRGSPSTRSGHTAIWTGDEMIVWGGVSDGDYLNTGGRYRLVDNSWLPVSTDQFALPPMAGHGAVWTGAEMLLWGGYKGNTSPANSGWRYIPSSDTWTAVSTGSGCPSVRSNYSFIWTGEEMVIWGGNNGSQMLSDGGRYNPATDRWITISQSPPLIAGRAGHTAVWTGDAMVVWGGWDNSHLLNTGGIYDPLYDTWIATSTGDGCPVARSGHCAVWTGTEMIVWGSTNDATGGKYNLVKDTWSPVSVDSWGIPGPRTDFTCVWTGKEMIVWGGWALGDYPRFLNSGGIYDPETDSWWGISSRINCPSPRRNHTAVWTGDEMVVWGGISGGNSDYLYYSDSGGRYNPDSDTWATIQPGFGAPAPRSEHSAIWTGAEMVIWGGSRLWVPLIEYDYSSGGGYCIPPCEVNCSCEVPLNGQAGSPGHFNASASPTASCQPVPQFSWDFGDGVISTEQNSSHVYAAAGDYTWTLSVTVGQHSCNKNGTIAVLPPCTVDCQAAAEPTSGRAPTAVDFSSDVTAEYCSGAPSFSWDFGDGETSSEQNPHHTYRKVALFRWTMIAAVGGKSCLKDGTINVTPGLPGDCDVDGAVSIGEVQKAINMFLGSIPPDCGVDCNGDGAVSIGELQKVINAFLGLPGNC